ncbi:MAG: PIG-L family deacetylase [Planctomycetes bacterium]|nr:PIG-L family deacetylase [Planctomycetota bacterium]
MRIPHRQQSNAPRRRWCPGALSLALTTGLVAQSWREVNGRSEAGIVPLHQALRDAGNDTLALLVASHPDDRYVLPAALLRYRHGVRVAILLATRGGGGQNSLGPETGDALDRIRTLETEAGASHFDADVWYLDRPDAGYRRTAAETFAEWGRDQTLADLVRIIRSCRPDLVISTHHAEESHGHDQALAELLPTAVALAEDPQFACALPAHRVDRLFLGASSGAAPATLRVSLDQMEPLRGATLRRLAYDVLRRAHVSPGTPGPMDSVFEPDLVLQPTPIGNRAPPTSLLEGLPSLFDDAHWPADREQAASLRQLLGAVLSGLLPQRELLLEQASTTLKSLRGLSLPSGSDAERRRDRRAEALERVIRHVISLQIEVEAEPGAVAVPGEALALAVRIHAGGFVPIDAVSVDSADGAETVLEPVTGDSLRVGAGESLRAELVYHVPLMPRGDDPMQARFHGDRFAAPVRLRFCCRVAGLEVPVPITVPVELRPPLDLEVVPRILILPTTRQSVQFTVGVHRNSRFPIEDDLEVTAPAGYVIDGNRKVVDLQADRANAYDFEIRSPDDRRSGVDVVRIQVGNSRLTLPIHKIDVQIDPHLRVGLVRGNDDTVLSVIDIGGFGLRRSELSDADLSVRDLTEFDTILVDIRALRDRPAARRSFRRLLDFATGRGKRLVVLYHKDTEFNPAGEGFRGAPFEPFQVGKSRITRADAAVKILKPDHVLWNHPNRIRSADWDGWEQERGLYFPALYGERYEELIELQDPGFPAERGAVLYARTGEGEYVYCALALWRQLKKRHAGAVRMLANLLSPRPPGP